MCSAWEPCTALKDLSLCKFKPFGTAGLRRGSLEIPPGMVFAVGRLPDGKGLWNVATGGAALSFHKFPQVPGQIRGSLLPVTNSSF